MTNKQKWNKGAPPSIGWWPASGFKDTHSIRWWNGEYWSRPAYPYWTAIQAAEYAEQKSIHDQNWIEWSERWWL